LARQLSRHSVIAGPAMLVPAGFQLARDALLQLGAVIGR